MTVVFMEAKTAAQRGMCESEHSHDAGSRSLKVCTGYFSSAASERCNRIFHSLSVLVEQILYA
jgi:hypothetical protein